MNSDFWLDDAAVNQKGTLPNVNDFFKGLPSTPAPVRVKKVTPLSSPDTTAHLTATSSMSDHPSSGSRSMTESLPKPSNRALATWEELTSRVHSKQATGPFPAAFSDSFSTDQQDPTPNHRGSSSCRHSPPRSRPARSPRAHRRPGLTYRGSCGPRDSVLCWRRLGRRAKRRH